MKPKKSKLSRIFLVGPMGVGKSTIGKMLADALGLTFIDSDQEVERRAGADIAWIFDVEGERGFREREAQVLVDLTCMDNVVIATGGGSILREESRNNLRKRGLVVHLDADIELLVERTATENNRPLLQGGDPEAMFRKLKAERDGLYESVRDFHVLVDEAGSNKVADEILGALKTEGLIHD